MLKKSTLRAYHWWCDGDMTHTAGKKEKSLGWIGKVRSFEGKQFYYSTVTRRF